MISSSIVMIFHDMRFELVDNIFKIDLSIKK
jgi:hypothetical protein